MDHFMDAVVDPVVNLGLDQSVEAVGDLLLLIQFYGAYFYDLKGEMPVGILFSPRTLIPLQIKDNIIHVFLFLDTPGACHTGRFGTVFIPV